MKIQIRKDVEQIIEEYKLNCSPEEFCENKKYQNKADWEYLSANQKLSESFIEKFQDKVNWNLISEFQKFSEPFIEKFQDKVDWIWISFRHKLSESFIEKYQNKVSLYDISRCQQLSESFIEKFQDKVDWDDISSNQKLSEPFIEKFQNKVNWDWISAYQKLSEPFIEKFQNRINIEVQKLSHSEKSLDQKIKEIKEYSKKHNLKLTKKYLYAFRNHDQFGKGAFNKTISYSKGQYYKDWHCDMNSKNKNSFGYGIFPEGNTKVRVKIEDWGLEVNRSDGKARVCGFEIV